MLVLVLRIMISEVMCDRNLVLLRAREHSSCKTNCLANASPKYSHQQQTAGQQYITCNCQTRILVNRIFLMKPPVLRAELLSYFSLFHISALSSLNKKEEKKGSKLYFGSLLQRW